MTTILQFQFCILLLLVIIYMVISLSVLIFTLVSDHFDFSYYETNLDRSTEQRKLSEMRQEIEERRNWKPDKSKFYVSAKEWEQLSDKDEERSE